MASSEPTQGQRGAALIATLLASALLMVIGAIASHQATVSFLISHRMRESTEALIAAETGLAAAVGDFAIEPRYERFDLPPGSGFPFSAPFAAPLPPSFVVDTEIRPRSTSRIDLVATATGRNWARRTVVATIERSDEPFVPATIFLADSAQSISFAANLTIVGSSRRSNPMAAIATPSQQQADSIRSQLESGGANLSGEPRATAADWNDLAEVLQKARSSANSLSDSPAGAVPKGIWASRGSVEIASASGSGVWLVDGDLTIRSGLRFAGILLVLGDIEFADGADVEILGSLVQAPPGRLLQSRGNTTISYSAAALREVEVLHPTLLGRRATLIGWRDDS